MNETSTSLAAEGFPQFLASSRLRLDGLAVLGIWAAEVLPVLAALLVAWNDHQPGGSAARLLATLGRDDAAWGLLAGLGTLALASTLRGDPPRRASCLVAAPMPRPRRPPSILWLHSGVALSLLVFFAVTALRDRLEHGFLGLATVGLVVAGVATAAAVAALRKLPAGATSGALALVGVATATGLVAAQLLTFRPEFLQKATLAGVDAVARLVFPDATRDLSLNAVGTAAFRVRVAPGCSGVEGLGLGLVLVIPYLVLSRHRLRFPRALLLVPLLLLSLGVVNIGRIALLLAVGRSASRDSMQAFHSSIGWLLFAVTIAAVIPLGERLLGLRADVEDGARAAPDPSASYLVPFIASLGTALAISAFSLGDTPFALLRYAAGAAALVLLPISAAERRRVPIGPPALAGVAVAVLYVVVAPKDASASLATAGPGGSGPLPSALAVLGYVLVTPLVEELAFRGYLMRRLVSDSVAHVRYEDVGVVAVALSSLAFGALHDSWVLGTAAGLAFALTARRCGGVGAAGVAHVAANGLLAIVAVATGRPELLR